MACLLRELVIDRPNYILISDQAAHDPARHRVPITCVPMRRGFLYLVVIVDRTTRRVPSWRLSHRMVSSSALRRWKMPCSAIVGRNLSVPIRIANSGPRFTQIPLNATGRCRWTDASAGRKTLMIERPWHSQKYGGGVYRIAFETGSAARVGSDRWITSIKWSAPRHPEDGHQSRSIRGSARKRRHD